MKKTQITCYIPPSVLFIVEEIALKRNVSLGVALVSFVQEKIAAEEEGNKLVSAMTSLHSEIELIKETNVAILDTLQELQKK